MQNLVIGLGRGLVVSLPELDICKVKVGVSRQIGVGVVLDVIRKFLRGQVVLARLVVA